MTWIEKRQLKTQEWTLGIFIHIDKAADYSKQKSDKLFEQCIQAFPEEYRFKIVKVISCSELNKVELLNTQHLQKQ